jgi:hypothetical protein
LTTVIWRRTGVKIGANSKRVKKDYCYYTNSLSGLLCANRNSRPPSKDHVSRIMLGLITIINKFWCHTCHSYLLTFCIKKIYIYKKFYNTCDKRDIKMAPHCLLMKHILSPYNNVFYHI